MRALFFPTLIVATLSAGHEVRGDSCARLCTMWIAEPRCVDNGNGAYECDAMARMTCSGYRWFCVPKSPIPLPYIEKVTWKPGSFSAPLSTAESPPEGTKPVQVKPNKR